MTSIEKGKIDFDKYHSEYEDRVKKDDKLNKSTEVIKSYVEIGRKIRMEERSRNETIYKR